MFRNLELQSVYTSDDNYSKEFYLPVLKNAISFDRTSAYFSSKALAKYSEGLEYFHRNGNLYRLIISKDISPEDYEEIKKGYCLKDNIISELVSSFDEQLTLNEEKNISNLAYFIANGTVEIKIAFKEKGIFHDKCGILKDANGDIICFRGSNNETLAANNANYESFQVTCSWLDQKGFYLNGIQKSINEFEKLWNNETSNMIVMPADKVIINKIMKYNRGKIIVDRVLLKPNSAILDYNNGLVLQINKDNNEWLIDKAFYKMSIKPMVKKIVNNTIYFNDELSYPDFIRINNLLENRIPKLGVNYYCTDNLKDYIEARNIHIESRSRLGIELKTDASKLKGKYETFEKIVNSMMIRELRNRQMRDAFFMYAMSKSGNFSVPGSGKTSSALAVYAFLKMNDLVDRIVVIGPKNAFASWIDEFGYCFGDNETLNYFSIHDTKYISSKDKKRVLKYDSSNYNMFLFNYESLKGYEKEIEQIVSKRTLLIFDEIHKVKAINGERAHYSLEISKYSNYTIAMTGTPIPNSYLDLFNLLHILFNDEYKDFFDFDLSVLKNPSDNQIKVINEKIQPFFCRTTKDDLLVPKANRDILRKLKVSTDEQRLFEIVSQKYRSNKLALFIRMLQLESNPQMLMNAIQLSDFTDVLEITDTIDEIDFVDYSIELQNIMNNIDITTKKNACIELIKQLVEDNKKVVVWCIFKDSIRSINQILNSISIKSKYIMGEVDFDDRNNFIEEFKNGEFDVLITNPHTLAESVSLHSVCHDAIYFEYSYNLVHLLQSKDRIHRLGLANNQYTQYYYLMDNFNNENGIYSLDEKVYNRLMEKEKVMIEAIENDELEPVYTTNEDLELIFGGLK